MPTDPEFDAQAEPLLRNLAEAYKTRDRAKIDAAYEKMRPLVEADDKRRIAALEENARINAAADRLRGHRI